MKLKIAEGIVVLVLISFCAGCASETKESEQTISKQEQVEKHKTEEAENPPAPYIYRLDLPEAYSVTYRVEDSYVYDNTYLQTMTRTPEGIFLDFGDSKERYIFEKYNGKYLEYQFNSGIQEYVTPTVPTDILGKIKNGDLLADGYLLDPNVVAGFTARITVHFDYYKNMVNHLEYERSEEICGTVCHKYTADYEEIWGHQKAEVWINPANGLCMKGSYVYMSPLGTAGTRNIECISYEEENVSLPEYK